MTNESTPISELLKQSDWLSRLALAVVRNAADADDLIQDVWLAALKNPPKKGRERSWFRSVLRRRRIDSNRKAQRSQPLAFEPEEQNAEDPLGSVTTLEAHTKMGEALHRLPEPYRSVVVARYLSGEEPADIANKLGEPAGTIRSRISRGLVLLREDLERDSDGGRQAIVLALLPFALQAHGATTKSVLGSASILKMLGVVMSQKFVAAGIVVFVGSLAWILFDLVRAPEVDLQDERAVRVVEEKNEVSSKRPADRASIADLPEKKDKEVASVESQTKAWTVVDDQGKPVFGARFVVHQEGSVLVDGRTKKEGRLPVSAPQLGADFVILAPGHMVKYGRFELVKDKLIRLENGAELSGVLHVSGGLPYRKLHLAVMQDSPAFDKLPIAVRKQIWPLERERGFATTKVAADGTFAMHGLDPNQKVNLSLPSGFCFESNMVFHYRSQSLDRPAQGVVLNVQAMPRVIGRLVKAKDGAPIPFHVVKASSMFKKPARTTIATHTDKDGRFVLGLNVVNFENIKLYVPRGNTTEEIYVGDGFADTVDIGDVVLAELQSWLFQVVDSDGAPIEKAILATSKGTLDPRSDQEGFGEVKTLAGEIHQLWVGASGFRTKKVDIIRGLEKPQVIRLSQGNKLTINLGELPPNVKVTRIVVFGKPQLKPADFHFDISAHVVERTSFGISEGDDFVEYSFTATKDGIFTIDNLSSNVPMNIEARDANDQVIAFKENLSLGASEHKTVHLQFDASVTDLIEISLVNPQGGAMDNIKVKFPKNALGIDGLRTDKNGRIILLRRKDATNAALSLVAEGFEKLLLPPELLIPGAHRITLQEKK